VRLIKGQSLFDLVATCDRLSSYNQSNAISSVWQDEHLKFLGGFIIVLSLRYHEALINMIYDRLTILNKNKKKWWYMIVYLDHRSKSFKKKNNIILMNSHA
jgi:hypothetical protein